MSGNKLLVDTNIVIYLLDGDDTLASFLQGRTTYISFITQLELLGFSNLSDEQERNIQDFLDNCIIVDINSSIKKEVIKLRRNYKIKLPDSIIMASSLYLDLPILTSDTDFNKVLELEVIQYEK
jgi:predicted nucleic acid-binding protein